LMPTVEVLRSTAGHRKVLVGAAGPSTASRPGRSSSAWDTSAVQKQLQRHLQELEKDNLHDVRILVPKHQQKFDNRKKSANLKRILLSKKTFVNYCDEAGIAMTAYHEAAASPSTLPLRKFCSICGYFGYHRCMKCGAHYCSLTCQEAHKETRCLKVYA